ncbi:MAG TPA: type IV pilus twitching motility protein PilT [Candidatus Acidoferrales bacterium]|nr:type IV pilus twitching motility protein PilT [Candidatus Acidoferrales bacterium]
MNRIDAFLELAVKQGGSDLHLVSGLPPRIRVGGDLQPVPFRELSPNDIESFLREMMSPELRAELEQKRNVDFAYASEVAGRFRANVYQHANGLGAVMRAITTDPPQLDTLGLPDVVRQTLDIGKGLVLVTGPTGAGKSTTLAAMVDYLNRTRRGHIITLEDPVEFLHEYKQCVITQREIGRHATSFADALRAAVREDPDVLLLGDMRDLETISLAMTAAETGTLVLGTLHTSGAIRTVDRVINVFPPRRQDQVRTMLADSLRLVISQRLVRRLDGHGRVAAAEVMVSTTAVSAMIRQANTHKLQSVMQAGQRQGMQSLDNVLQELVRQEIISGEEAYENAIDRTVFDRYVSGELAA